MIAKEAKHKAKVEVASLEVKWTSLLLEVGATKDEVSPLQSQVSKNKAAMEKDYQKALELIFAYGYRCCMFKHNICGDQPEVLDDMLDSSDPFSSEFLQTLGALYPNSHRGHNNQGRSERSSREGRGTREECSYWGFCWNILSSFSFSPFSFEISVRGPVWPP